MECVIGLVCFVGCLAWHSVLNIIRKLTQNSLIRGLLTQLKASLILFHMAFVALIMADGHRVRIKQNMLGSSSILKFSVLPQTLFGEAHARLFSNGYYEQRRIFIVKYICIIGLHLDTCEPVPSSLI